MISSKPGGAYESLAFLPLLLMSDRLPRDVRQQTRNLADKVEYLRIETTRWRHIEAELRHLAHHDRLTRLPKHLRLHKPLHAVLGNALPPASALIMFEIQRFRTINEALGHDAGDLLLGAVAERMTTSVPTNSLVI